MVLWNKWMNNGLNKRVPNFPDPENLLSCLLNYTFLGPVVGYYNQVGPIRISSSYYQATLVKNVLSKVLEAVHQNKQLKKIEYNSP